MRQRQSLFFLLCAMLLVCCGGVKNADLVLLSAKVVTVDGDFSVAEAVAVRGEKIVHVGSDEEVRAFIGPHTVQLALGGALVLPGLIDAHAHLNSLGDKLTSLNISGAKSYREVVDIVAERVKSAEPDEWILGGRWDHNRWMEKAFPVHDALSRVSPDNPVYLTRVDGNSAFVNAKALEIAGITRATPDPEGGRIIRKKNGEPTGVLINRAMNIVKEFFPEVSEESYREKIAIAAQSCLEVGLTGVHEAGIGPSEIEYYKKMYDDELFPLRVYAMLGEQEEPMLDVANLADYFKKYRIENYNNYRFSVRSIKLFFDGALGSRGAAFFEPYEDDPTYRGLLRIQPEYITRVARAALLSDMGVNTHCIGIRGNRLCLDAYEAALMDTPKEDHRFRIEHAQIVRREDVEKFATLGVIPAMQPTHCTSDMIYVADRVGVERAEGAYAWRWFLDAGLKIPCGSDFPVESNNPLLGIYASVTRQDTAGNPAGGWYPDQRMIIEEAIKGFTIWAAYGAFQEEVLGSIEPGKLADFTVLDKDILEIEPAEMLTAKVLYTIIAGEICYRSDGR